MILVTICSNSQLVIMGEQGVGGFKCATLAAVSLLKALFKAIEFCLTIVCLSEILEAGST